jgi:hypothetical protein
MSNALILQDLFLHPYAFVLVWFWFGFLVLGIEFRALYMVGKHSTIELRLQAPLLVDGIT